MSVLWKWICVDTIATTMLGAILAAVTLVILSTKMDALVMVSPTPHE